MNGGLVAQAVRRRWGPEFASPCGFRGARNGVWVGFPRGFSCFPLPQILFHHFTTLISSISFHFIRPCDGASGVVGRHPCYSRTYNIGASSNLIPRPDLALDTSWGYLFILWILNSKRNILFWNETCVRGLVYVLVFSPLRYPEQEWFHNRINLIQPSIPTSGPTNSVVIMSYRGTHSQTLVI